VFLDISLTSVSLGKLIIQLFSHTVPKTAENFRQLCMGDPSKGELTFKNCRFHSIVAEVMMSSGDITHGDGTGGMSIYGPSFADESLQLKAIPHVGPGIVTMVNTGRDSNNSQFAVTLGRAEWLDGTCVVVGKVVEGLPLLNMVAQRCENPHTHSVDYTPLCKRQRSQRQFDFKAFYGANLITRPPASGGHE
ncbi:cyclophilin-type peptidyl-prolyl cis-trans isomerase-2, Bmcyp-2, partial [Baffinella frigidus]